MGLNQSKTISPSKTNRIELDRQDMNNIRARIKKEIDEKQYSLFMLRSVGWKDEVIALKRDSLHEKILRDLLHC